MALKFAVENAVPGARLWLDQDQRDKTERGMRGGVAASRHFVIFLTRCYFSRRGRRCLAALATAAPVRQQGIAYGYITAIRGAPTLPRYFACLLPFWNARWFCQVEVQEALKREKPFILVREMDSRQGGAEPLTPEDVTVRCSAAGCCERAAMGPKGGSWPTLCKAHAAASGAAGAAGAAAAALEEMALDVSSDVLNYSLIYDELKAGRMVVAPSALQLAHAVFAGKAASVVADIPWCAMLHLLPPAPPTTSLPFAAGVHGEMDHDLNLIPYLNCIRYAEMEFREVSLSKLLESLGMQTRTSGSTAAQERAPAGAEDEAGQQATTAASASAPAPQAPARDPAQQAAAGAQLDSDADTLLRTFSALSCGVGAPPLGEGFAHHACLLAVESGLGACRALKAALEGAFDGARVALPAVLAAGAGEKARAAVEADAVRAATTAHSVVVFLTLGVLKEGSPTLAAVAAALRRPRYGGGGGGEATNPTRPRFILVHETSAARGGAPSFERYLVEASASFEAVPELRGLFSDVTSIPWQTDPDVLPVRTYQRRIEGGQLTCCVGSRHRSYRG